MKKFSPFIKTHQSIKEFSLRAMILGGIFSLLFAVSNAYLALKIGTTISASIPAAILSMATFKLFFSRATILENNLVQTVATVGEGLAAGVVFTIPALFFLGAIPSIQEIFLLSFLGGILGVLFMIPMRRFIIVEEHGKLPFPEGTACAEILQAGQKDSSSALTALFGFIVSVIYKFFSGVLNLWKEVPSWTLRFYENTIFSIDTTPALLAVGYIVGYNVSSIIFSGGVFAWFILIPLIKLFGTGSSPIFPASTLVSTMSGEEIWSEYVRYIGAGTLAAGGLMSLIKISPILIKTLKEGYKELKRGWRFPEKSPRVDQDIPLSILLLGSLLIIFLLWLLPNFSLDLFTIFLLTILGFFFSAVTSLTVGIVGSTSNPVSGMAITTLLITSFIFVALGWNERIYLISAITMSAIANITICMASTTSQDLKTGFLLGATPIKQQIAEIIGTIIPALSLGFVIYILNEAYTLGSSNMPAPQATMMAMIAKGVINQELPYTLFLVGIILGGLLECLKVPTLPFALGVYLPLSLTSSMMGGGLVAKCLEKLKKSPQEGTLLASGIIGGDACMGVLIAVLSVVGLLSSSKPVFSSNLLSLIAYIFLAAFIGFYTYYRSEKR